MSDLIADTHAVIWHLNNRSRLSAIARKALAEAERIGLIFVSSISLVEMIYLTEKGRIAPDVLILLRDALDDPTTAFRLVEVNREVTGFLEKIARQDVPDMPDRIIAATALYLNLPLVTRDGKIKTSGIKTIW